MVQLSARTAPGPFATVVAAVSGLGALAVGVALLRRADTAFGWTWAALPVVLGTVVLLSLATRLPDRPTAQVAREVTWEGERAQFLPRATDRASVLGLVVLALLGGWVAVMGVVGAVTENWVWPLLAVVPAVYFLGFPVLALLGRFRVGGTWLTPTRVVDEHLGLRSELPLADVAEVVPRTSEVHVVPAAPAVVTRTPRTPRPWRARPRSADLVLSTHGMAVDSGDLAARVRAAAGSTRG